VILLVKGIAIGVRYTVNVGYYTFWRQQVIWCPSNSDDNTKISVDLKNM